MMQITLKLNGKNVTAEVAPDMALLDFVRDQGCYSVKEAVKHPTVVCVPY